MQRELVDDDFCFNDDDIDILADKNVQEIEDIDQYVLQMGVDPDALDAPWNNGFPL